MRYNRPYPPISRTIKAGHERVSGRTLQEMVASALHPLRYNSATRSRAEEIYNTGGVKNPSCRYGKILGERWAYNDKYTPNIKFTSQVRGSEGNNYDVELNFLRSEGSYLYHCTCPMCNKVANMQLCKHIYATLLWIQKEYHFDRDNYELEEEPVDIENARIKLHDKEVTSTLINTFDTLTQYFYLEPITKLRLYEKACRFLEKGLRSKDDDVSSWSDIEIRNEFKKMGKDYDTYMNKFLYDTEPMIGKGRQTDNNFFFYQRREGKYDETKFSSFKVRVDDIENSIAINPFQVANLEELQRVFDTYARITKFKVGDYVFEGKYIFAPNYYEVLMIEAKNIPDVFYRKFKLGNHPLEEGKFYQANNKIYIVLCNYLNGYNPRETKDENY